MLKVNIVDSTMASSLSSKIEATKLQRPPQIQTQLYCDILHNQQTDTNGDLADTLLVCYGGTIRVHAFIVQMASPFLRTVFQSQGNEYPYIREVLLPDFPVKDIHQMLNLIYKGSVNLHSEKEMSRLQDTLSFFQVSCHVSSEPEETTIPGSLKIHLLDRIPPEICKPYCNILEDNTNSSSSSAHPPPIVELYKRSSIKGPNPDTESILEDKPQNHQNVEPEAGSGCKEGSIIPKTRKRRSTAGFKAPEAPKNHPVVKLPRARTRKQQSQLPPVPVIQDQEIRPQVAVLEPPPPPNSATNAPDPSTSQKAASAAPKEEDLRTDSEDENWEQPNYRDKKWFIRESRRCQVCNTSFKSMTDASMCFGTHKDVLRCYFCFTMYSDTIALMRHFKKWHRQVPGRENILVCPYCDEGVHYNSVSEHVITQHLNYTSSEDRGGSGGEFNKFAPGGSSSVNGRPPSGRSATVSLDSSQDVFPAKRKVKSTTPVMEESSVELSPQGKKKRKGSLTFAKMNKMMRNGGEGKNGDGGDEVEVIEEVDGSTRGELAKNVLVLKDLDLIVEKVTFQGKVLTFRLQKKRDLMEPLELDMEPNLT